MVCHRVKRSAGTPRLPKLGPVAVTTQFETVDMQPRRPKWLCSPSFLGEPDRSVTAGMDERELSLLCYRTRSQGQAPTPEVFLSNVFGERVDRLNGARRELCVPAAVDRRGEPTDRVE